MATCETLALAHVIVLQWILENAFHYRKVQLNNERAFCLIVHIANYKVAILYGAIKVNRSVIPPISSRRSAKTILQGRRDQMFPA